MIGKKIETLLQEINMTQRELAKKCGVTEVTISRYIHGERQPKSDIVSKIASALGVSTDYLLGKTDDPETRLMPFNEIPELAEYEGYLEVWKELKAEEISPEDIRRIVQFTIEMSKKNKK